MPVEQGRYDGHHYVFESLPDNSVLWRFMDLPKFLSLLEFSALHFCRADHLGDPFEGSLSAPFWGRGPRTIELLDGQTFEAPAHEDDDEVRKRSVLRQTLSVSCWNHGEIEVDALWSKYASYDAGVAVRTTFGRLVRSFGEPYDADDVRDAGEPIYVGPVRYVDYATELWPEHNGFYPFMHKRLSFAHEQEVRAVVWDVQALSWDADPFVSKTPVSRLFRVDLNVLIDCIVVSPLASAWFVDLIERVVARYQLQASVESSALAAKPTL